MGEFDVAIVGYGPTGKMLARLLADEGHKVAVVERWEATYPLPRAIAFFHDAKRMFHSIGLMRDVRHISQPLAHYVWYSQDWEPLVDVDFGADSLSGGAEGYTFSQPDLEGLFDAHLNKFTGITFFKGYEVQEVSRSPEAGQVTIAPFDQESAKPDLSKQQVLKARYVVGCDGTNSIVRQARGSGQIDLGFDARWLVVDVKPHDMSAHVDIPDLAQWCNPARPTTIVPCGIDKRRWEFMMAPDETVEDFTTDENVWRMIAQWIRPDQATIVRKAVYNFRSLIADRWRNDRLLLAGDAAHLMPPFMGQGLGWGLRDAWTLGWEMDLVLKGPRPTVPFEAASKRPDSRPVACRTDAARHGAINGQPRLLERSALRPQIREKAHDNRNNTRPHRWRWRRRSDGLDAPVDAGHRPYRCFVTAAYIIAAEGPCAESARDGDIRGGRCRGAHSRTLHAAGKHEGHGLVCGRLGRS